MRCGQRYEYVLIRIMLLVQLQILCNNPTVPITIHCNNSTVPSILSSVISWTRNWKIRCLVAQGADLLVVLLPFVSLFPFIDR
uniref:Uncharacterized protein n=1 Tax=Rhizophora mucronata TaxID=61149 RepID=A0A2P2JIC7_RHIMU